MNDVFVKYEMWLIWFLLKFLSCKFNVLILKYVFILIFGDRLCFILKVIVMVVIFFNNLYCKLIFEIVNWFCWDYNIWLIFYYDFYEYLFWYKILFKLNIWFLI